MILALCTTGITITIEHLIFHFRLSKRVNGGYVYVACVNDVWDRLRRKDAHMMFEICGFKNGGYVPKI